MRERRKPSTESRNCCRQQYNHSLIENEAFLQKTTITIFCTNFQPINLQHFIHDRHTICNTHPGRIQTCYISECLASFLVLFFRDTRWVQLGYGRIRLSSFWIWHVLLQFLERSKNIIMQNMCDKTSRTHSKVFLPLRISFWSNGN